MSLTFTIDPEEPEVAYVRDAAGRQLAQINLFDHTEGGTEHPAEYGYTIDVIADAARVIRFAGNRDNPAPPLAVRDITGDAVHVTGGGRVTAVLVREVV